MAKAIGKINFVDKGRQNVASLMVTKEITNGWAEEEFVVAIGMELEPIMGKDSAQKMADTVMRVAFRCPNIEIAVVVPTPLCIAPIQEAINRVRKSINKEVKKMNK